MNEGLNKRTRLQSRGVTLASSSHVCRIVLQLLTDIRAETQHQDAILQELSTALDGIKAAADNINDEVRPSATVGGGSTLCCHGACPCVVAARMQLGAQAKMIEDGEEKYGHERAGGLCKSSRSDRLRPRLS